MYFCDNISSHDFLDLLFNNHIIWFLNFFIHWNRVLNININWFFYNSLLNFSPFSICKNSFLLIFSCNTWSLFFLRSHYFIQKLVFTKISFSINFNRFTFFCFNKFFLSNISSNNSCLVIKPSFRNNFWSSNRFSHLNWLSLRVNWVFHHYTCSLNWLYLLLLTIQSSLRNYFFSANWSFYDYWVSILIILSKSTSWYLLWTLSLSLNWYSLWVCICVHLILSLYRQPISTIACIYYLLSLYWLPQTPNPKPHTNNF